MIQTQLLTQLQDEIESTQSIESLNLYTFLKQKAKYKAYFRKFLDNGYIVFLNCELNDNINVIYCAISTAKDRKEFLREQLIVRVDNPDGTNKTVTFNHWAINAYDENGHKGDVL